MNHRFFFSSKRALLRLAVLLALVALVLAAALLVALHGSDTSRIVICNETGAVIPALKVEACGQSTWHRRLEEDGSFRWQLAPKGGPGEIALETATEPPWRWRGAYIQPRGGYRVTLRLWPDGQVEAQTQISFWQRLFYGALDINE
jgi:hypothetical protein